MDLMDYKPYHDLMVSIYYLIICWYTRVFVTRRQLHFISDWVWRVRPGLKGFSGSKDTEFAER
jgi:hypothetical protein